MRKIRSFLAFYGTSFFLVKLQLEFTSQIIFKNINAVMMNSKNIWWKNSLHLVSYYVINVTSKHMTTKTVLHFAVIFRESIIAMHNPWGMYFCSVKICKIRISLCAFVLPTFTNIQSSTGVSLAAVVQWRFFSDCVYLFKS